MVKKIAGFDEAGRKVFERDARDYDKKISDTIWGVSLGDILKAAPIAIVSIIFYANTMDFRESQLKFNDHVVTLIEQNSQQIQSMRTVLENLNNYLSASTGKQFNDGVAR